MNRHFFILTSYDSLYGYGNNRYGVLGWKEIGDNFVNDLLYICDSRYVGQNKYIKNIKYITMGDEHTIFLTNDRKLFGCGSGLYGRLIYGLQWCPTQKIAEDVQKVECGKEHTIIYTDDKKIYGFGMNKNGQLGTGDYNTGEEKKMCQIEGRKNVAIQKIRCGVNNTFILTKEGEIYVTGTNNFGCLGMGEKIKSICTFKLLMKNRDIKNIYFESSHCFIEIENSKGKQKILCFGSNQYGQLGMKENIDIIFVPKLFNIRSEKIERIECGSTFTIFYTVNGKLYGCGTNHDGEIGLPTNIKNIHKPRRVLKDQGILSIKCGYNFTLIYKYDGSIILFANKTNPMRSKIFKKYQDYENITILNKKFENLKIFCKGNKIQKIWNTDKHKYFEKYFKNCIFTFICCLNRKFRQKKYLIPPRFIKYKIFNYL